MSLGGKIGLFSMTDDVYISSRSANDRIGMSGVRGVSEVRGVSGVRGFGVLGCSPGCDEIFDGCGCVSVC